MSNSKLIKNTLILSILTMFICTVAFVGTTIAWFTASVSNSNNVIKSGTVNIALLNTSDDDSFSFEGLYHINAVATPANYYRLAEDIDIASDSEISYDILSGTDYELASASEISKGKYVYSDEFRLKNTGTLDCYARVSVTVPNTDIAYRVLLIDSEMNSPKDTAVIVQDSLVSTASDYVAINAGAISDYRFLVEFTVKEDSGNESYLFDNTTTTIQIGTRAITKNNSEKADIDIYPEEPVLLNQPPLVQSPSPKLMMSAGASASKQLKGSSNPLTVKQTNADINNNESVMENSIIEEPLENDSANDVVIVEDDTDGNIAANPFTKKIYEFVLPSNSLEIQGFFADNDGTDNECYSYSVASSNLIVNFDKAALLRLYDDDGNGDVIFLKFTLIDDGSAEVREDRFILTYSRLQKSSNPEDIDTWEIFEDNLMQDEYFKDFIDITVRN